MILQGLKNLTCKTLATATDEIQQQAVFSAVALIQALVCAPV